MAVYKSKYPELGFYVDGERHKFVNGEFKTDDKSIQKVLDNLADVAKVEEPKQKAEAKPKQAEKSASKK